MHERLIGPGYSCGRHGGEHHDMVGGIAAEAASAMALQPAGGAGKYRRIAGSPLHDNVSKGIFSRRRWPAKPGEERPL